MMKLFQETYSKKPYFIAIIAEVLKVDEVSNRYNCLFFSYRNMHTFILNLAHFTLNADDTFYYFRKSTNFTFIFLSTVFLQSFFLFSIC